MSIKATLTEAESTPEFPNPVLPNVQMEKRALKGGAGVHCAPYYVAEARSGPGANAKRT